MSLQHNFDEIIDRKHTNSSKWLKYPADVLPMWVADSDFKCPELIVKEVVKLAEHGVYGYPWVDEGSFEKATCNWMKKRFNWEIDTSMVDFVPSLGTALAIAVKAFTEKGDYVLMNTPIYPPFVDVVKYNNRQVLGSSLVWKNQNYEIDFEDFEKKAADPKTKLFLFCNPHNPTGRAFTEEELRKIGDICVKHNVYIFSDDIHCDYLFSGKKHIPFPSLGKKYADICVVGINPSKTFNIAGMRTAAVISPNKETQKIYKAALSSCKLGRTPFGILSYTTAYNDCDYYADQVNKYIEGNVEYAVKFINGLGKISTYKPDATYLLWLDCRALGLEQAELEKFFLEKAKVALISGTNFGAEGKGFMRINLACPRAVLEEGLNRISKALSSL